MKRALDRIIEVSFALALLSVLPASACIVLEWRPGFIAFGGAALFFGMLEMGSIAIAALIGD